MKTRAFYPSWQMHCCGDSFSVGDEVIWTATAAEPELALALGALEGAGVEWVEEHHQDKRQRVSTIEGTVSAIRAIWQTYEPHPTKRMLVQVAGGSKGRDVTVADGRDGDGESVTAAAEGEFCFTGYVVTLQ